MAEGGLVAIFVTQSGAGGAGERSSAQQGPREPWPSEGRSECHKPGCFCIVFEFLRPNMRVCPCTNTNAWCNVLGLARYTQIHPHFRFLRAHRGPWFSARGGALPCSPAPLWVTKMATKPPSATFQPPHSACELQIMCYFVLLRLHGMQHHIPCSGAWGWVVLLRIPIESVRSLITEIARAPCLSWPIFFTLTSNPLYYAYT